MGWRRIGYLQELETDRNPPMFRSAATRSQARWGKWPGVEEDMIYTYKSWKLIEFHQCSGERLLEARPCWEDDVEWSRIWHLLELETDSIPLMFRSAATSSQALLGRRPGVEQPRGGQSDQVLVPLHGQSSQGETKLINFEGFNYVYFILNILPICGLFCFF